MHDEDQLTVDMPIAELGRQIMAEQFAIMGQYGADLRDNTAVISVHETRKAIRRTFTAIDMFSPYFAPDVLTNYRRRLKKLMKRLARSRDTAVFINKLQIYAADSAASLTSLERYWQDQLSVANANVRLYLARPRWAAFWQEYAAFIATSGQGVLPAKIGDPIRARYITPILLYRRTAAVRAYDDYLHTETDLSIKQLHALRIQCKELRYAFQFFTPLLGPEIAPVIAVLEALQLNLGDLNDARVALRRLDATPGRETAVAHYRAFQTNETVRLLAEFHPLWAELNAPAWRRNLAAAISLL